MGFRLRRNESLEQGTRRIAREQVAIAQAHLDACGGGDDAEHVHDARRALTRLRGVARLIRPGIGEDAYGSLNRGLREAVRSLSGARDADVAIATLERLGRDSILDVEGEVDAIRRHTAATRQRVRVPEIGAIGDAFESVTFERAEAAIVRAAVNREVDRLRRRARAARRGPTPEAMHDWRKSARHVRALLRVLVGANRRRVRAIERRVNELCDVLGELHDCQVVREQLVAAGIDAGRIEGALGQRERWLQLRAFKVWRGTRVRVPTSLGTRIARWRRATRKR